MKSLFIIIALFITSTVFSQEKYLSFTKTKTGKESLIKENSRIRLKTIDGKRLKGRVQFTEDNMLEIKGEKVSISNIEKIKRDPLLLTLGLEGVLILSSGYMALGSLIIGAYGGASVLLYSIPITSGLIYASAKTPNIIPAFKLKNYKDIKIIQPAK